MRWWGTTQVFHIIFIDVYLWILIMDQLWIFDRDLIIFSSKPSRKHPSKMKFCPSLGAQFTKIIGSTNPCPWFLFVPKTSSTPQSSTHPTVHPSPLEFEMWTVDHARDDSVQASTSLKNYPPKKKKKGHNNGESVRVTPYAAVFNSDISMGQRNNKILRKSIYILTL